MMRMIFGCVLVLAHGYISLAAEPPAASPSAGSATPAASPAAGSAALERRLASEAAIQAALEQQRDFEAVEKPLTEFLDELERDLGIDISLHAISLEDEGLDCDTPVTIDLTGQTVRTALETVLDPLGLTHIVDGEVLLVATKAYDKERLLVRVYDVADLVLQDVDDPQSEADYDTLCEAITKAVDPSSWDMVGGSGSIAPFNAAGINALVVSQTRAVHGEIELLLTRLRRIRRADTRKAAPLAQGVAPGTEDAGPAPPSGPLPPNADRDSLRAPQTLLACALYAKTAASESGRNFLVSPYSVYHALSMAAAGAKGKTASELAHVLQGELPPERFHEAMAAQAQELPLGLFQGQQLRLANRLWAQRGQAPFVDDYLRITRTHYGAELAVVDFADDAARKAINSWIEDQTSGRIREMFAAAAFDASPRLVLTNAIYFQGLWRQSFPETNTEPRAFHTPTEEIQALTMHMEDPKAEYVRLDGLELLTKRYRGSLAMTVLLPEDGTDFSKFERSLTAENLHTWLASRTQPHVQIFLPRFKHETSLDLQPILAKLGIKRVFTAGQADLTGICPDGDLFLSGWKHRATIEVDEKGTVAAAATAVGGFGGPREPAKTPVFRADRPFVFLIRDLRTETILFIGRVLHPAK